MFPWTGRTWTCPSLGLCSAMSLSGDRAVRDAGNLGPAELADPIKVYRYSGYIVFTPPLVGSTGTQSSFFNHSVSAVFWPGRKCGTGGRSVPPFSANEEPLDVSVATVLVVS